MLTFGDPVDLPFQAGDVAAHYGFTSVEVKEIKVQTISPGTRFCAGATSFIPQGTTTAIARGWILENQNSPAQPLWKLLPDFALPPDWFGYSIRGINDSGNICGLYFRELDPNMSMRPFVKHRDHDPVEILDFFPTPPPPHAKTGFGTGWDINNNTEVVGEYDIDAKPRAFRAHFKLAGDPEMIEFADFLSIERIKSFNQVDDLLLVREVNGINHQFFKVGHGQGQGDALGKELDITAAPIFANAQMIMMNGINHSRIVAGFFGQPPAARRGFLGKFSFHHSAPTMDPFVFSHPDFPQDTRLFSISDHNIVVGIAGLKKPFFLQVTVEGT